MAAPSQKRRRGEEEPRRPKKKIRKFKKQAEYHSSSEDSDEDAAAPIRRNTSTTSPQTNGKQKRRRETSGTFAKKGKPVQEEPVEESSDEELDETAINTALNTGAHDSEAESGEESEGGVELEDDPQIGEEGLEDIEDDDEPDLSSNDDEEDEDNDSDPSTTAGTKSKKKRNDPEAFATSISKILTTKLTTQKRSDPILSRSRTADEANKALADEKLETKARAAIRAERKSLLEKGRVKDVLGFETPGVDTGAIQEEEKRLKKIAQRGVVKLFNAVRAAQVRAEEADNRAKAEGVVGMRKREDRVNEMSKEGFLDLISRGGKQVEA